MLSNKEEKHDQKAPEDVADWTWETTRFWQPPRADKGLPGLGWSRSTHIGNYSIIRKREDSENESKREEKMEAKKTGKMYMYAHDDKSKRKQKEKGESVSATRRAALPLCLKCNPRKQKRFCNCSVTEILRLVRDRKI